MKPKRCMREALTRLASMEAMATDAWNPPTKELQARIMLARDALHACGYPAPGDEGWHCQNGKMYKIPNPDRRITS